MSKSKSKSNITSSVVWLIGLLILCAHAMIIAKDVQTIIQDPNKENKPEEVLKLAFDLTRYVQ